MLRGWFWPNLLDVWESMVLIICTKNESNLTNRYWDMVPDGRTDRMDGRTDDAKTISLRLRRRIIKVIFLAKKSFSYSAKKSCWYSKLLHNHHLWKNLIILYCFQYNGKSMLHLKHMHIFRPRQKHLQRFKKDMGKIVGGVAIFVPSAYMLW